MSSTSKRTLSQNSTVNNSKRAKKSYNDSYLHQTLKESGLLLKYPDKCTTSQEVVHLVRHIKKNLEMHYNYPSNITDFVENLKKECEDDDVFKHYLFPTVVMLGAEEDERLLHDSVIKILLSVPIIQTKLMEFIFEKAVDFAALRKCGSWIQMILKCLSSLDNIVDREKVCTNLIDLLEISSETMVKLQIITVLPDIVSSQDLDNIVSEMTRILYTDHELIPAILDCLSNLCLSDEQYEQLQKKTLTILSTFPKFNYYPNFIKFLLLPGRTTDGAYLEAVIGIRNALAWPDNALNTEIASSQVLTAAAIGNSMVSKITANCWIKVLTMCKIDNDHKPIDLIILLLLYKTSDEKQRKVENLVKKQIKMDTLKENLLNEAFDKFLPMLKDNLKQLINLAYGLLKVKGDVVVQSFASHLYTLMLSKLVDCGQTIISELLQLDMDSKLCLMNILMILNNIAASDISLLKCQSIQMLTLLDSIDNMSLAEIRGTMNLVCALAFKYDKSDIRDDINMIIMKQLGSSKPMIKVQGILAGIHAVKYLMASCSNESEDSNSDDSLKEATQTIELISKKTRQFPDMIAFFYDELSTIISSATYINKNFLSWLADAVTNDLEQNFIVESIDRDIIGELKLSMQYCLNSDHEMDQMIAINIAGLTLNTSSEVCVAILSPLFELVQIIHSKLHDGDLSSIDALLGCPIIMPKVDIDEIENMDQVSQNKILDCLIYAINWFRELLNAFAAQADPVLKEKTLKRVIQMEELELLIVEILTKTKLAYKPPICTFNINKYKKEQVEQRNGKAQISKQKNLNKADQDQTVLSGITKTQTTQIINKYYKQSLNILQNLPLRQLNLNLFKLFNNSLSSDNNTDQNLRISSLKYLLICVNNQIHNILVSKIKKNTFLSKQDVELYDVILAEKYARSISEILPKINEYLKYITYYLDHHILENAQNESGLLLSSETLQYLICLEYIFNMLTIYLKWIGFQNSHNGLLKSCLRTIADVSTVLPQKELIDAVAKHFCTYEKYCLQLSTAVSLIELLRSLQIYTNKGVLFQILRDMSHNFMSLLWKSPDGVLERGLIFNQNIDLLASTYLTNSELIELGTLVLQLTHDIKSLKGRNDVLPTLKTISKANFSVLYRNIGNALYETTKKRLCKGMTNHEHLGLWKEVANVLNYMSDIARTLDNRNNYSIFFKKSLPVLRLFLSQGVPMLEIELKSKMEEVVEILKILQKSTRFLQSLCCHSRLKKDKVLMNKVPFARQLLEQLIYKVKASLAAANCPQAFWMGNLKNKDIHGEIIASQESIHSEESVEDCDDQLPEDEPDDDMSDDEILNPDSRSLSDII